jgi:hypothetical protein
MNLSVFEAIYNTAQIEIERLNSEIKGDENLNGTFFDGCQSDEIPNDLAALLKIQGLALDIINNGG